MEKEPLGPWTKVRVGLAVEEALCPQRGEEVVRGAMVESDLKGKPLLQGEVFWCKRKHEV